MSVKSAITAIKVISYVYSNHFGAIFSPTKVAKVFLSAKKYVLPSASQNLCMYLAHVLLEAKCLFIGLYYADCKNRVFKYANSGGRG